MNFMTSTAITRKRTDADYEIDSVSKALAVLEALEGTRFEPVRIQRIMQRTGFSKDLCFRTLCTLRLRGYAERSERGEWTIGPRFIRMAHSLIDQGL